ncbi:MAG: TonB-dependent receptor plug domain-containing protein [Chitinophagaceae bacterium]|nr:TonB-dependent receptor plug domain-containing protein [Chitinophagaceae bacterium]
MKRISFLFSIILSLNTVSQEKVDTASLNAVVVKGFESNKSLINTPASISLLSKATLNASSAFSMLPALNTSSGVRMEERSPGSYRLSIRGSLLRSPFGIRNVKVYYDDFILTDAGGNTYMNLLDIHSINGLELIKGPAGSVYGAGTGGAVLLNGFGALKDSNDLKLRLLGGSFGTLNQSLQYQHQSKNIQLNVGQGHFQSNGFRVQSKMRKDNVQLNMRIKSNEQISTDFMLFYSDLFYQTPGGLTFAQFNADPRQSRPATATLPSVVDQKTAIYNKSAFIGFSNTYKINSRWKTVGSVTNGLTQFKNPFITNYEKRREFNLGFRSKIVYENNLPIPVQWVSGFEIQRGEYAIDSSGNIKGAPDGNKVSDEVIARQQFAFTQLNIQPLRFLQIQSGLSINRFFYSIQRTTGAPANGIKKLDFNRQLLPRIALLAAPAAGISLYGQLSKGYSSPSIAEIRPSAGGVYSGLQAEYGWSKEIGLKLSAWRNKLYMQAALFQFDLRDAIVRRVNNIGAEYFVNEGDVQQKGIEIEYQYNLVNLPRQKFFKSLKWSQAITLNDFRFVNYKNNQTSFAGNQLTGIADNVIVSSLAMDLTAHFYWNVQFNYVGKMPLNDANTFFSNPYRLWQSKIGWRSGHTRPIELFLLMDNIGNENYSLGFDINAFGNRFYNPAPSRNYQFGLIIDLK